MTSMLGKTTPEVAVIVIGKEPSGSIIVPNHFFIKVHYFENRGPSLENLVLRDYQTYLTNTVNLPYQYCKYIYYLLGKDVFFTEK